MLRAAATTFGITVKAGAVSYNYTREKIRRVYGPLKTTVTLLEDGPLTVCLIASHFETNDIGFSLALRGGVADDLRLPTENVLAFTSHNHSIVPLLKDAPWAYEWDGKPRPPPVFTPPGRELFDRTRAAARGLREKLRPVTVWWGLGHEGRITYNRKGRRADGSTYFMREEDRRLVGRDYCGDIDTEAPVLCLRGEDGRPVTFITQFTGHPVTAFHTERPIVFGEWPQIACDMLAARHGVTGNGELPVSFLQGCAGDMNSKEMFEGGMPRAKQFGRMLGMAYLRASKKLTASRRAGMDFRIERARLPLASLPSERVLRDELDEISDFIRRAEAGDENTITCVGLNFPRALSPAYRGKLVELIRPWNEWALDQHTKGTADRVPKFMELPVHVLRLGDVGIVGMECEPFLCIGRQIRAGSPLPLTIPVGYANTSYGYVPDGANAGDREYMSSFHRYTRYRAPFRAPAGDVMARVAVKALTEMAKEADE